jgi:hypothetical protein
LKEELNEVDSGSEGKPSEEGWGNFSDNEEHKTEEPDLQKITELKEETLYQNLPTPTKE